MEEKYVTLSVFVNDPQKLTEVMETLGRTATGFSMDGLDVSMMVTNTEDPDGEEEVLIAPFTGTSTESS